MTSPRSSCIFRRREFHSADKRPLLLRLIIDEGCAHWSGEALQTRNEQVAAGLEAGKTQSAIARDTGLSPSQVSRIAKRTKQRGRIVGDAGDGDDADGEPARGG
jgi:hypothetical protein